MSASAQFASVVLTDEDLTHLQNYSVAPKIYVDNKINDLLNNAPAALDTLNEIAQALGTPDVSALEINVAKPPVADSKLNYVFNDVMTSFDLSSTYGRYTVDGKTFYDNATVSSVSNGMQFVSDLSNTDNTQVLDHVKALYLTQSTVAVPADGQVAIGAKMKVTVDHKDIPSRFSDHLKAAKLAEDFRVGSAALICGDFGASWMVLDTFRTNEMVYALYERLPFGWDYSNFPTINKTYAAFTYVIPIHKHTAGETVNAHFIYDQSEDRISWYVNGVKKLTLSNMGKRLTASSISDMSSVQAASLGLNLATIHTDCHVNDVGGNDPVANVKINSFSFGPGIFTLLDFLPTPNLYTDDEKAGRSAPKGLAKIYEGQTVPTNFFLTSPSADDLKTLCNVTLEVDHIYAFKLAAGNLGSTLIKRIDNERAERIAAVDAEASARINADNALQSDLSAEVANRAAAVTAEASARAAADADLESRKYDKTGGAISGLVTAQAGLVVELGNTSAKLRIGDYWRINASNDGKRLQFEYSANGTNWTVAVPFIQP